MRKVSFLLVSGLFFKRHWRPITIALFVVMLSGYSRGGPTSIPEQARQAIDPSQVRLFVSRPLQYELIGLVETANAIGFSRHAARRYAARERAKKDLKQRAAEIGANGVLVLHGGSRDSGGFFSRTVTTQMKAIYVIGN